MSNELKGGGTGVGLSPDINVITAEINAYQRVAGEAIFEIGRRLHRVRYNPKEYGLPEGKDKHGNTIVARGYWGEWLAEVNIENRRANDFMKVYEELGESSYRTYGNNSGLRALYEIATLPPEQREAEHVTSKGEQKTPDEMTVKELREVKKALKDREQADKEREARIQSLTSEIQAKDSRITQAEARAAAEQRERERLEQENADLAEKAETLADKPAEVRYETKTEYQTEYIEVRDEDAERRLREYEEKFGDLRNYDEKVTATHRQDMLVAVMSLSKGVKEFVKRYSYMTKYYNVVDNLDDESKQQYDEAINALKDMAHQFEFTSGSNDIIDAVYSEIK